MTTIIKAPQKESKIITKRLTESGLAKHIRKIVVIKRFRRYLSWKALS